MFNFLQIVFGGGAVGGGGEGGGGGVKDYSYHNQDQGQWHIA